jgi:hypothetical protein
VAGLAASIPSVLLAEVDDLPNMFAEPVFENENGVL